MILFMLNDVDDVVKLKTNDVNDVVKLKTDDSSIKFSFNEGSY